jgi:hypothetical protein
MAYMKSLLIVFLTTRLLLAAGAARNDGGWKSGLNLKISTPACSAR